MWEKQFSKTKFLCHCDNKRKYRTFSKTGLKVNFTKVEEIWWKINNEE